MSKTLQRLIAICLITCQTTGLLCAAGLPAQSVFMAQAIHRSPAPFSTETLNLPGAFARYPRPFSAPTTIAAMVLISSTLFLYTNQRWTELMISVPFIVASAWLGTRGFDNQPPVDEEIQKLVQDIITQDHSLENLSRFANQILGLTVTQQATFLQSLMWVGDWPEVTHFVSYTFTETREPARHMRFALMHAMYQDPSRQAFLAYQHIISRLPQDALDTTHRLIHTEQRQYPWLASAILATTDAVFEAQLEKLQNSSTHSEIEKHSMSADLYQKMAGIHRTINTAWSQRLVVMITMLTSIELLTAGGLSMINSFKEGDGTNENAMHLRTLYREKEKIVSKHYLKMVRDLEQFLSTLGRPIEYFWISKWLIRLHTTYIQALHGQSDQGIMIFQNILDEHLTQRNQLKHDQQKRLKLNVISA